MAGGHLGCKEIDGNGHVADSLKSAPGHSRRFFDVQVRSGCRWTAVWLQDSTIRRDGPRSDITTIFRSMA